MSDYRTLLAEQTPSGDDGATADDILATRIPWLCPDCEGDGYNTDRLRCGHRNAPTIGDLLHWGENVARVERDDDYGAVRLPDNMLRASAVGLLAALRTEADQ